MTQKRTLESFLPTRFLGLVMYLGRVVRRTLLWVPIPSGGVPCRWGHPGRRKVDSMNGDLGTCFLGLHGGGGVVKSLQGGLEGILVFEYGGGSAVLTVGRSCSLG